MDPIGLVGKILVAAFLVAMMFSIGLELGAEEKKDRSAKRHARRLLARGLFANLVALPLLTYALVRLLHGEGAMAAAVLLAASVPGGRYAPRVAAMARAELGLAVELVLFLTKLTPFVAPVLLKAMFDVPRPELHDLVLIAQLLALQFLPYLLGRRLRRARPSWAAGLARPLLVVEAGLAVLILVGIFARGDFHALRVFGPRALVIAIAFSAMSIGVGWLFGGGAQAVRRAFAVTTGARNLGLGLLLAGEISVAGVTRGSVQLALFGIAVVCGVGDLVFALAARAARSTLVPQRA